MEDEKLNILAYKKQHRKDSEAQYLNTYLRWIAD